MAAHNLGRKLIEARYGRPFGDVLVELLKKHNGETTAVARELDVQPITVRRWKEELGISVVATVVDGRHAETVGVG